MAEAIVSVIQSMGGAMTLEDLLSHASTLVEPIRCTRGGRMCLALGFIDIIILYAQRAI